MTRVPDQVLWRPERGEDWLNLERRLLQPSRRLTGRRHRRGSRRHRLDVQIVASGIDQRAAPAPGVVIEVNGYPLHVRCTGQGNPTVILETGLGAWSSHWALVQPVVAEATRVCSYDRAGRGWSDSGPLPRDARRIAMELHALLGGADIVDQ